LNLNLATLVYLLISYRARVKEKQGRALRTHPEGDLHVAQDENELSDDVDAWLYSA
jgi:hypothetical protein